MPEPARLDIYRGVSPFEFSADETRRFLSELEPGTPIDLHIHSPGGDVFEGAAIFAQLLRWSGRKRAFIEGWAASIASVIAMAADEVIVGPLSAFFIHLPWSFAVGAAETHEDEARDLRKLEPVLRSAYLRRWTADEATLDKAYTERGELFMAEEAVELGLADRVEEGLEPPDGEGIEPPPPVEARQEADGRAVMRATARRIVARAKGWEDGESDPDPAVRAERRRRAMAMIEEAVCGPACPAAAHEETRDATETEEPVSDDALSGLEVGLMLTRIDAALRRRNERLARLAG